ncbi:type II secretion system F family protein [Candidatus Woesearchaeota archaeon]|nr:type II secretion system F family protein [Candidatus Woesearchaeota archaeon]
MSLKVIFLEEFGKAFVPKRFIPNLRKYMLKAGFNEVPYKFFGLLFYISALITTLIFIIFVYPYLKKFSLIEIYIYSFLSWFTVQLFFAVLFILLVYFYLDLKIYFRTKKMEEQLPDFLQVLSANLKGGMTFEKALWTAVKPRFNVLGSEMAKASKKVMTGYEIGKALTELADKYDSLMLRRTIDLIISEVESGGNVAELLDRLVGNLKETKALKDEMSASAIAYVIFISVIVIVISPLLFALSFHLLILLLGFIAKISVATQRVPTLPFVFSKASINPGDFKTFSLAAIFVISFFSSLIVSIVEKGDMKGGVKYIPIYVFGSMSLYFIFLKVLGMLFGNIV